MAVASLSMQLTDYQDAACSEIYGGSGYSSLVAAEQAVIDRLVLEAERTTFLHPPVGQPYVWSCLRDPGEMTLWADVAVDADVTVSGGAYSGGVTTLTCTGGTPFVEAMVGHSIVVTTVGTFVISAYTSSTVIVVTGDASAASADTFSLTADGVFILPSTFESPDTPKLIFRENVSYCDPPLMDWKIVESLRATDESEGYPQFGSIRWRESDGTAAQTQDLVIYPRLNDNYDVALPYIRQPVGMSTANPYPLGGPEMADLLLTAVIAVCEKERSGSRGDRWAEFIEKSKSAVMRDRTRHHNFSAGFMRPDAGRNARFLDVKSRISAATGV